jgi:hypothetical protein
MSATIGKIYGIAAVDLLLHRPALEVEAWLKGRPRPPRRRIPLSPESMAYAPTYFPSKGAELQLGKLGHLVYCNGGKEEVGLTTP